MSFLKQLQEKSKTQVSQENINGYGSKTNPFTRKDWTAYFEILQNKGVNIPSDVVKYFTTTDKPFVPTTLLDGSIINKEPTDYAPPFFRTRSGGISIVEIDVPQFFANEGYDINRIKNIAKYRTNKNPNQIKLLPDTNYGWIPLALWSEHGVYPIVIDMDPAKGGKVGQIIYVQIADGYLDTTLLASSFSEFMKKMSMSSIESKPNNLHPVAKLIIRIVAKALFKKYLANPTREFFYTKMRYQRCTQESLDATLKKLRGINDTAIVDGFEVKEVPGKSFTNTFIVNNKQLKTEEDIYKGIDIVISEISKLDDIIIKVHQAAKKTSLPTQADEDKIAEIVNEFIGKYIPKNYIQQFLPTKTPDELTKVGGCNNHGRIKSKMINAIRPELYAVMESLEAFKTDDQIEGILGDVVYNLLKNIVDRYFTFMADVTEWMYRSMRRQTKKTPIATESLVYYYGLEEAEKEELEYDTENTVEPDDTSSEEDTGSETVEETSEETTESESNSEKSDDEEIKGTSDEGTEEKNKNGKSNDESERPEVKLDNPDEEKEKIKEYLSPLAGDNISNLTLYSAKEVNRPLYHVSMNPHIQSFYPKVSKRTLSKEDRSIPRISTSTSLIGCLNGYQSMISDMEGRETKNFSGLFKVYDLPYQYAIKPNKDIVTDVENSDEYWLVSWKRDTYSTIPKVAADFTIPKIETVYGNDGKDYTYHCYIRVYTNLYLDHQKKLSPGYYHVVLNGYNFRYPLTDNNLIQVHDISETEYNKVVALSMMIKSR